MDLAADNVLYCELHVCPRAVGGMTAADFIAGTLRGIQEAEPVKRIEVRLIVSIMRTMSLDEATSMVELAAATNTKQGERVVVGVSLAGDPRYDKMEVWDRLSAAFEMARSHGLRVSLNFGEVTNTAEMMQ